MAAGYHCFGRSEGDLGSGRSWGLGSVPVKNAPWRSASEPRTRCGRTQKRTWRRRVSDDADRFVSIEWVTPPAGVTVWEWTQ